MENHKPIAEAKANVCGEITSPPALAQTPTKRDITRLEVEVGGIGFTVIAREGLAPIAAALSKGDYARIEGQINLTREYGRITEFYIVAENITKIGH